MIRTQRIPESAVAFSGIAMLGVGSVQAFRIIPFHIPYLDTILIPIGLVYIRAADLLPEAHQRGTSLRLVLATIIGVMLIFTVTRFLNL